MNQAEEEKCVGRMRNGYIVKGDWGKLNSVGGVADCGRICKEKSENGRTQGEGKRVRKRINGVREEQTADGLARKRAKMGGYGVNGEG